MVNPLFAAAGVCPTSGKVMHASRGQAMRHRGKPSDKRGDICAYKCKACRRWHVGHITSKPKQRIKFLRG